MSPPLTPDAAEARRQLAEELAKADYLNTQSWLQDLVERLVRWLTGGDNGIQPFNDAQAAATVVTVVLIVAGVGLFLWTRLGPVRTERRRRAAVVLDETRGAAQLRQEAAALAASGDWTLATLQTFRALVRSLDDRAIIHANPGLTAHEAAEQAAGRLPEAADRLSDAAAIFDRLAYGRRKATAQQYQDMAALDADVAGLRPTTGATTGSPASRVGVEAVR